VGPGEAITEFRLYPDDVKTGGVSAMIAPGKRAMAVKGNKVLGLSGFIRPGNHVDVLVALSPEQKMEKAVTKLVLENVLVLATGTELQPGENGEEPSSVDTYTLELSPEESELLAWAANQGTLHFALRNGMDEETVVTDGSTMAKALARLRAQQPSAPKAAPRRVAQRAAVEVEVITGGSRRTQEF
jgi:pilus assembly protein CpaB